LPTGYQTVNLPASQARPNPAPTAPAQLIQRVAPATLRCRTLGHPALFVIAVSTLMLSAIAPIGAAAASLVAGIGGSPDMANPAGRIRVLPPSLNASGRAGIPPQTRLAAASGGSPAPLAQADGGWEAKGVMLSVGQRGSVKSSEPLRPIHPLTSGARVTSVIWRIENQQPLPPGAMMAICLSGQCVKLDGLAGRSDALAGVPADNPLTLQVKVNGSGALNPPILLTGYQILINYRIE